MERQERMFAMVEKWKQSKKTGYEFAPENGISKNTLYKWHKRYQAFHLIEENEMPAFIEVTPSSDGQATINKEPERLAKIDIEFPCGMRIKIY
ncbi:MAG: transposase [Prolixibacteraceae bacterium]|nr:transposase [Prolixibacteraceae bacterium]